MAQIRRIEIFRLSILGVMINSETHLNDVNQLATRYVIYHMSNSKSESSSSPFRSVLRIFLAGLALVRVAADRMCEEGSSLSSSSELSSSFRDPPSPGRRRSGISTAPYTINSASNSAAIFTSAMIFDQTLRNRTFHWFYTVCTPCGNLM